LRAEIVVLGDEDTVYGFRLAGVKEGQVVNDSTVDEVKPRLDYEGKIIFISEDAASLLGGKVDELRRRNALQVIPGKNYKGVRDLIKDTIGFDINV